MHGQTRILNKNHGVRLWHILVVSLLAVLVLVIKLRHSRLQDTLSKTIALYKTSTPDAHPVVADNRRRHRHKTFADDTIAQHVQGCINTDEGAAARKWAGWDEFLIPTFPYRMCRTWEEAKEFKRGPTSCEFSFEAAKCKFKMTTMAVVVPFPAKQIDMMQKALKFWGHPDVFPCDRTKKYRHHVDLVFQFTDSFAEVPGLQQKVLDITKPYRQCFREVRFLSMNLDSAQKQYDGNRFSPSPSTMFHTLLGMEEMVKSYSHFFLFEPDALPFRAEWVDRLLLEVMLDQVDFWQKGSMAYYNPEDDHHINGNALYRLGHHGYNCFLERVLSVMYPYSFDYGQYFVMQKPDNFHLTHRYIRSLFIQNSQWKFNIEFMRKNHNESFLVHGKAACKILYTRYADFLETA